MSATASHPSVRFSEEKNEVRYIPATSESSDTEKDQSWYSLSDYTLLQKDVYSNAGSAMIFQSSSLLYHLYHGMSDDESGVEQTRLNSWSSNCSSLRGLEKLCDNKHKIQREEERMKTRLVVLYMQSKSIDANRIAGVCALFSKRSKQFASMMGQADAYAAAALVKEVLPQASTTATAVHEPEIRTCYKNPFYTNACYPSQNPNSHYHLSTMTTPDRQPYFHLLREMSLFISTALLSPAA